MLTFPSPAAYSVNLGRWQGLHEPLPFVQGFGLTWFCTIFMHVSGPQASVTPSFGGPELRWPWTSVTPIFCDPEFLWPRVLVTLSFCDPNLLWPPTFGNLSLCEVLYSTTLSCPEKKKTSINTDSCLGSCHLSCPSFVMNPELWRRNVA